MQQKDILKLFELQCREQDDVVVVRQAHFCEIMKGAVDMFMGKKANKIFSELPFRGSISKFSSVFFDWQFKLKEMLNFIFLKEEIIERFD